MWELQRNMHSWIVPSIMAHAEKQRNPVEWLVDTLLEQAPIEAHTTLKKDLSKEELIKFWGDASVYWNPLLQDIAKGVIEYGSETNGGHEFYLHASEYIPWCDEDYYQTWWA